jgi:hypothetical protein
MSTRLRVAFSLLQPGGWHLGGYQISYDFGIASNGIVIASSTGSKIHNLGSEMRFLDRLRQV